MFECHIVSSNCDLNVTLCHSNTVNDLPGARHSMTKKTFVLDTNVLLHDPMSVFNFHEHAAVIPMTVLEELDDIKDRKSVV